MASVLSSAPKRELPASRHEPATNRDCGVGDEEEGSPDLTMDGPQLQLEPVAKLLVQGPQWFVEEQRLRVEDERPGQGDPLLLPTGQLARVPVRVVGETGCRQRSGHPLSLLGTVRLPPPQR
jgi:hypothetical protein